MTHFHLLRTLKSGEKQLKPCAPYAVKYVCSTAHILGACKVSIQQGRYTFRHDTVLRKVIEVLKTFILNIKEAVPILSKLSIRFLKKGAKMPHKRTPLVGIINHASDWALLADLNSNY